MFRTVDPRTEEVEFAQSGDCFTDKWKKGLLDIAK